MCSEKSCVEIFYSKCSRAVYFTQRLGGGLDFSDGHNRELHGRLESILKWVVLVVLKYKSMGLENKSCGPAQYLNKL